MLSARCGLPKQHFIINWHALITQYNKHSEFGEAIVSDALELSMWIPLKVGNHE